MFMVPLINLFAVKAGLVWPIINDMIYVFFNYSKFNEDIDATNQNKQNHNDGDDSTIQTENCQHFGRSSRVTLSMEAADIQESKESVGVASTGAVTVRRKLANRLAVATASNGYGPQKKKYSSASVDQMPPEHRN